MIDSTDALISLALWEDIGHRDVTTDILIDECAIGSATILAKENFLLAGLEVFTRVFYHVDKRVAVQAILQDGDEVAAGSTVARVTGPVRALLSGERTALNFLQRLSGVATLVRQVTDSVRQYPARIVDTRKTTPGWRQLEKDAVRIGGARNHRCGLYDGVLIKDNHIRAAGDITTAVSRAREQAPFTLKIEVEVESLAQLEEALASRADIIMLDNMSLDDMREAVKRVNGRAIIEASGGITPENVEDVARTGVDVISMRMLTSAPRAVDISMELD